MGVSRSSCRIGSICLDKYSCLTLDLSSDVISCRQGRVRQRLHVLRAPRSDDIDLETPKVPAVIQSPRGRDTSGIVARIAHVDRAAIGSAAGDERPLRAN